MLVFITSFKGVAMNICSGGVGSFQVRGSNWFLRWVAAEEMEVWAVILLLRLGEGKVSVSKIPIVLGKFSL